MNAPAAPAQRLVLLGASNLTRGISTVLTVAEAHFAPPLQVLAALGHGRSYGIGSRVLGRWLPGIVECGLWKALSELPPAPTAGLLTDVGNDLLYEVPPERIAGWVEECLDRLAAAGARTVVTQMPMGNVAGLSRRRYALFRTLLFPRCRLSFDELRARAEALDAHLRKLCAARGLASVELQPEWYGLDPIHLKLRHWHNAWSRILAPWSASDAARSTSRRQRLLRWLYLRSLAPQHRAWLGFHRRHAQPSGRLRDGTTIALY